MTKPAYNVHSALEQVAKCGFECEGGAIEKNAAWAWLSKALKDGPKYLMGQVVDYEVRADVAEGVTISGTKRFTIIGIRMGSTSDGRSWSYDLSNDPPSAYHYGKPAQFRNIAEAALTVPAPKE